MLLKSDHHVPISYHWLPDDEITDPWPAILITCKQLRRESLEVFFRANTFCAHSTGSREKLEELIAWMHKIEGTPLSAKRLIRSIKIDVCDSVAASDRATVPRAVCDPALHFDTCDRLLHAISESRLRAHQLDWSGFEVEHEMPSPRLGWTAARMNGTFPWLHYIGQNLFNKYALTPLLRKYDLYDERNPPGDILGRLEEDCWRDDLLTCWRQLEDDDGLRWKGSLPEQWYSTWSAAKEQGGADTTSCNRVRTIAA